MVVSYYYDGVFFVCFFSFGATIADFDAISIEDPVGAVVLRKRFIN